MSVAVWGIAFAVFLLGLPMLAGANAFNVSSSIATSGLCLAYALPISFRMLLARGSFEAGPFNLGRYMHTSLPKTRKKKNLKQHFCLSTQVHQSHFLCNAQHSLVHTNVPDLWAARYNTWLLITLTPKGVVFSFLVFSFCP